MYMVILVNQSQSGDGCALMMQDDTDLKWQMNQSLCNITIIKTARIEYSHESINNRTREAS